MFEHNYKVRCDMTQNNTISALSIFAEVPYTTTKMLSALLNKGLSPTYKLVNRLEKEKLIEGHNICQLRLKVWTITSFGYHTYVASIRCENPIFKESRVCRISPLTIRHELLVQQAHINSRNMGFSNFRYGHSLSGFLKKRPDAIASDSAGQEWAIEVENFPKSKKRVAIIMSIYLQEIAQNRYSRVAYICPTENLAWSIRRLFLSVNEVEVGGQKYQLEPKHYNKFVFFNIENWPNTGLNYETNN